MNLKKTILLWVGADGESRRLVGKITLPHGMGKTGLEVGVVVLTMGMGRQN